MSIIIDRNGTVRHSPTYVPPEDRVERARGNWGHAGRPGHVGGSAPGGGTGSVGKGSEMSLRIRGKRGLLGINPANPPKKNDWIDFYDLTGLKVHGQVLDVMHTSTSTMINVGNNGRKVVMLKLIDQKTGKLVVLPMGKPSKSHVSDKSWLTVKMAEAASKK